MNTTDHVPSLARVRAGVRAVLALGVAASIAANVLHAQPSAVGRAIAAWSPLALLLTVELISRVPVTGRGLSGIRMTATAGIAGIAAWVSYWHMVSVATRYGEATTSAHLLPLSVDGLVIVASVSLVEIAAKLRTAQTIPAVTTAATVDVTTDGDAPGAVPGEALAEPGPDGQTPQAPGPALTQTPAPAVAAAKKPAPRPRAGKAAASSTAGTVARLRDRHPAWTVAQIAERAGVSERTARRHLNAHRPAGSPAAPSAALATPTAVPAESAESADAAGSADGLAA